MTTNWSEEKHEGLAHVERTAKKPLRANPESLVIMPTPKIDQPLTSRMEEESHPTAGSTQWKTRFIAVEVILVALAGLVIFFVLNVARFGVLGSALTVAGFVASVGLGHYLLSRRVG
jgi:hypothetical protein